MIKDIDFSQHVHDVCSLGINLFKIIMGYLKPITPFLALTSENFLNINELNWNDNVKILRKHKINKFKPLLLRLTKQQVQKVFS